MMTKKADDASSYGGDELPYALVPGNPVPLPFTPSLFLPVMDEQLASNSFPRFEQIGSSVDMEVNVPCLLAPPASNSTADYIISHYGHEHNILHQFYPFAAGNPYDHFFTLVDENMANFGATPSYAPLGLSYGDYRGYYFPPTRGGYAYGYTSPPLRCCQVDGCTADLSKAKRYHRRHRVCEHHSKAPIVITSRAIMPQRFCQQCSRFHEVDEFDDMKKSCRQRLADHNRRRRKPKPSSTDVPLKKRAHAKKRSATKDEASSSRKKGTGNVSGTHAQLGSKSKEQDRSMGLGEAVRESAVVDPKGKAPMMKQLQARVPEPNLIDQGIPLASWSGNSACLLSSQTTATGATSNIVQESAGLALHNQHYHQQGNILQLGHAMFDLDFDL